MGGTLAGEVAPFSTGGVIRLETRSAAAAGGLAEEGLFRGAAVARLVRSAGLSQSQGGSPSQRDAQLETPTFHLKDVSAEDKRL